MDTVKHVRSFQLQRSTRPSGAWLALATAIHALVIIGMVMMERAARDAAGVAGSLGGGGGGGRAVIRYIALPPAPAAPISPRREDRKTEPRPAEFVLPKPKLQVFLPQAPKLEFTPHAIVNVETLGSGVGSGAGSGSGSGGGSGTGQGAGVGSNSGPGVGDHRYVLAPEPRSVIYPFEQAPQSIKGWQFNIRFWVDDRGRVTKVEVEPPIEDQSFLRKLLERMYQWTFYPARMADGSAVEGELVITYQP